ncbi:MAG: HD domain-containing protein [Deltaproteobacteria bacterium]|nr:HD domain-containing protein [Deltaproteobacteria bacterium]MDA8303999.1 HD domain-containing protein [Deltaproteobacteria bacterium]
MINELASDSQNADIDVEEFIKFYLALANRNLNHLGKHSENVQIISAAIAENYGIKPPEQQILKYGALLHDIGKMFLPAEILNAGRTLTSVEFEIIKTHTMFGWNALDFFHGMPTEIKALAMTHHHRNGHGYPKQFIHKIDIDTLLVDILTVADSFAAIMEPRVYKRSLNEAQALAVINDPDNDKNAGLNRGVLEVLKYLVEDKKISLNSFF